jgi:hypothetical protein
VVNGNADLLDFKLSDFKQVSSQIAIGSRPAYFHRMYEEALKQRHDQKAIKALTAPPPRPAPTVGPPSAQPFVASVDPLFAQPEPRTAETDEQTRTRFLAAAEREGFGIPTWVQTAGAEEVKRWYGHAVLEAGRERKV